MGVHDGLLAVVVDQVDHLVLADAQRRVGGGWVGARRHSAVGIVAPLLNVVRIRLDVLLLLMMVVVVMVVVAVVVMMVLGMERVNCSWLVQV